MTNRTWLMICNGSDCDCADSLDVNDTVVTSDGTGTVRVLMEHTAEVQLDSDGESYVYKLADLHLTESAGAMKDA